MRHFTIRFHKPVLSGDVTYIDAEVTGLSAGPEGYGTAHLSYTMINQDAERQYSGIGKIELPLE